MALESADTIWGLNPANPPGTDLRPEGDNHLRLIKSVLQGTFLMDEIASRPSAGTADRLFFSTDEMLIYRDNGANWEVFGSGASGQTITGDTTLEEGDHGSVVFVDTSSADVTVTLPAEATAGSGWWVIFVKTSASNSMIIEDDASVELGSYDPDEATVFATTDATDWYLTHWADASDVQSVEDTLDALANSSGMRYLSSNQTFGLAWTRINVNAELYDPGGNFSNYRYTVPATGTYLVSATARTRQTNDGDDVYIAIYKNGSILRLIGRGEFKATLASEGTSFSGAIITRLSSGDFIELYGQVEGGNGVAGGLSNTGLEVTRLS